MKKLLVISAWCCLLQSFVYGMNEKQQLWKQKLYTSYTQQLETKKNNSLYLVNAIEVDSSNQKILFSVADFFENDEQCGPAMCVDVYDLKNQKWTSRKDTEGFAGIQKIVRLSDYIHECEENKNTVSTINKPGDMIVVFNKLKLMLIVYEIKK